MPRSVFYGSVVASLLAAMLGLTHAGAYFIRGAGAAGGPRSAIALVTIVMLLATIIGVAAILLRMASLLAARNLFSAFLAGCSTTAAVLFAGLAVVTHDRSLTQPFATTPSADAATAWLSALQQVHAGAVWASGMFLMVTLLALLPYFRLHARLLAPMIGFPVVFFLVAVAAEIFTAPVPALVPAASASAALFVLAGSAFLLAVAVHAALHRHQFIEVTNLRMLFDSRIDPLGGRPRRFPIGRHVAFEK